MFCLSMIGLHDAGFGTPGNKNTRMCMGRFPDG